MQQRNKQTVLFKRILSIQLSFYRSFKAVNEMEIKQYFGDQVYTLGNISWFYTVNYDLSCKHE